MKKSFESIAYYVVCTAAYPQAVLNYRIESPKYVSDSIAKYNSGFASTYNEVYEINKDFEIISNMSVISYSTTFNDLYLCEIADKINTSENVKDFINSEIKNNNRQVYIVYRFGEKQEKILSARIRNLKYPEHLEIDLSYNEELEFNKYDYRTVLKNQDSYVNDLILMTYYIDNPEYTLQYLKELNMILLSIFKSQWLKNIIAKNKI